MYLLLLVIDAAVSTRQGSKRNTPRRRRHAWGLQRLGPGLVAVCDEIHNDREKCVAQQDKEHHDLHNRSKRERMPGVSVDSEPADGSLLATEQPATEVKGIQMGEADP